MFNVLYHKNCTDGTAAAWATSIYLNSIGVKKNETTFTAMDYNNQDVDFIEKDSTVFVVDFSLPIAKIEQLMERNCRVIVLDHHKTAYDTYARYAKEYVHKAIGDCLVPDKGEMAGITSDSVTLYGGKVNIFCDVDLYKVPKPDSVLPGQCLLVVLQKFCGTSLVWSYLVGGQIPDIVKYVEDRDLWKKQFPETDSIIWLTRIMELDHNDFIRIAYLDEQTCIARGAVAMQSVNFFAKQCTQNAGIYYAYDRMGNTVRFIATNAPHVLSSETCQLMLQNFPDIDCKAAVIEEGVVATFSYEGPNVRLSFRSNNKTARLLAERLGGGGHDNAAGVVLPAYDFKYLGELK